MDGAGAKREVGARIYGGQERDERVAERRQRLVDSGIRLFGSNGYHATTLRSVIAESGLATRYFYESFRDLESLLIVCYQHLMTGYREKLNRVLSATHGSVEDVARAGLRCFFTEMQNPHFARVTQIEILGISPTVDQMYQDATQAFGAKIVATFSSLVPAKALVHGEAELLGITLAGAVAKAGAHWTRAGYRYSIDQMVETTLLILTGTANQLSERMREGDRVKPAKKPKAMPERAGRRSTARRTSTPLADRVTVA